MSYRIRITSVHVPGALDGVPLPVEIVGANGAVRRTVLMIQQGDAQIVEVQAPGDYLVRAELPSGQWLSGTAGAHTDPADQAGETQGAVLDFATAETPLDQRRPEVAAQTAAKNIPPRVSAPAAQPPPPPGLEAMFAPAPPLKAGLQYGLFGSWLEGPRLGDTPAQPPRILSADWQAAATEIPLPGSIRLPAGLGWASDTTQWRPVLVRATLPAGEQALLVTPPAYSGSALTLLPDPETGLDPQAPPLLAVWDSGHKTADALFSYVQRGALDLAREAAPTLVAEADSLLAAKGANPIHATIAAYTLLTIGDTTHGAWLANLANWFTFLPDGAIIYGWYLIRGGQAEQAPAFFQSALARGLPLYTAGVRLLRDGLNFLAGIHRDDAQIRAGADLAYHIAAAANFDSELTCLRLGEGGLALAV